MLQKHLRFHRQARDAKLWVEIKDRVHRSGFWGLRDFGASLSFIAALCVKELGLEVETLEKPLHVSSQYMRQMSVISRHPISTGFRRLTGYQRDPWDRGVT